MQVINDELDKLHNYDIPPEVIETLRERIAEHVHVHRSIFRRLLDKISSFISHDKR